MIVTAKGQELREGKVMSERELRMVDMAFSLTFEVAGMSDRIV